ncbi:MAG: quinol:cytochrome C oxidoreductase [Ignavibacteriaceae bacterium]|jgi:hypothetical protein
MSRIDSGYIKKELPKNLGKLGIILLVAGIILSVIAYLTDPARAAFSYLTAFVFLISIGLGSLFLVSLEYAAGAVWSVPFRRISEFYASSIPYFILIVIPLFFSMHNLFTWMNPEVVAQDKVLQGRMVYLNVPFFVVRDSVIFLIWWLFYALLIKNSRKQDESSDQMLTTRNIKLSLAFIPVFAFTISIISFDWMMSMTPKWFSTIFGVYLFAGSTWVALAVLTLSAVLLTENGYLSQKVRRDHYYSLGTLLFAFTVFWAYIAFAQYMLQWYGNLPEEIIYFIHRWTGGWKYVSLALVIAHFIVPFLILLPRSSKTNPKILIFVSIWIIAAQYLDSYWLVMPDMVNNGFTYSINWMDMAFPIAVVGLVIVLFNSMAKRHNLIPLGDPKLQRSFDFHL